MRSRGCSREGRVLQPDAARAHGRGGLQRAAPACAPAKARCRGRAARPETCSARRRRRSLPRREQPRLARVDRGRAASLPGSRRPARLRAPPPRRRDDRGPARRARLPRRDGARARRRRTAARPRRPGQAHPAALGVPTRGVPAHRLRPPARDRARRPLADGSRPRARRRVRGTDLGRAAPRVAGARRRCRTRLGWPNHRVLRGRQLEQADPGAPACVRGRARAASGSDAPARRADVAGLRPRPPAPAARPRRRGSRARGLGRRAPPLGADGRRGRMRQPPAPDDGRDVGERRSARSRSESRSSSATWAGSPSSRETSR